MMRRNRFIFLICSLNLLILAGLGGGTYWWMNHRPAPTATNLVLPAAHSNDEIQPPAPSFQDVHLKDDLIAAQQANAELKSQLSDVLNWILTNIRGRYPLQESDLSHLQLPLVDEQFSIHPSLADFLQVSADERFLVDDALEFTRTDLRILQDRYLSISTPAPNQLYIQIKPFRDEGLALREDLLAALEVTLGKDRSERFQTVAGRALEESFDFFGQAERTLLFEVIEEPQHGLSRLIVNDGWFDDRDPAALAYAEKEITVEKMPNRYRDFSIYLPKAFDAFTGNP